MIGLWRESDRTVVCADTMRTVNIFTGIPQIGEMPARFTYDIPESRRSIRKLAALEAADGVPRARPRAARRRGGREGAEASSTAPTLPASAARGGGGGGGGGPP